MFESLLAKYYQEDKERLQKTFLEDIKINLKKKKNKKKKQYACKQHKDTSEDEKQKLVEHRRKYYRIRNNALF